MQKDEKKYSRRGWLRAVGSALAGAALAPAVTPARLSASPLSPGADAAPAYASTPSGLAPDAPSASPRKVSRIAALQEVACVECDACMPCGYGVDIPGNFLFYNRLLAEGNVPDISDTDRTSPDFRRKAIGFLRRYDREIPDRHQSQRCIKCFHCVAECRHMVFIVNELAALTAITDELRDWECQNI